VDSIIQVRGIYHQRVIGHMLCPVHNGFQAKIELALITRNVVASPTARK